MIKEVRYNGYAANPSEYQSADGDLGVVMNLVPEDGGLSGIAAGKNGFDVENGVAIFIHKPEHNANYISYGNGIVKWLSDDFAKAFEEPQELFRTTDDIVDIASLGNIIVVSTSEGMHYVRWSATDGRYIYLGTQVPKIFVDFGLKLHLEGVYDNQEITLADGGFFESEGSDWVLIGKTTKIELTEWYFDNNGVRTFKSSLDGVVFEKEFEYELKISHNLSEKRQELKAISLRSGTGDEIGAGNPLKLAPKSEITDAYFLFNVDESISTMEYSVNIYRGLRHEYDELGNPIVYRRIEHTQENFNHITGQINKFINEKGRLQNKFIYPFFVRYAVRLYDGNYSYVSPPMLMLPNTGYSPCISYGEGENKLLLYSWVADLQHRVSVPNELGAWDGLITGIDLFVSSPIYTYNQGEEYTQGMAQFNHKTSNTNSFGIGIAPAYEDNSKLWGKIYTQESADTVLNFPGRIAYVEVCPYTDAEVSEKASNVANYYLIKSYTLKELTDMPEDFADVEMPDGTLNSLETRQTLRDATLKYIFKDNKVTVYNNHLIAYNGKQLLPNATTPRQCRSIYQVKVDEDSGLVVDEVDIYIHLKTNQGERMVKASEESNSVDGYMSILNGVGWLYYPSPFAYKATVFFHNPEGWQKGEYLLKTHEFMDGAYWVGDTIDGDMLEHATWTNPTEVNEWRAKSESKELLNIGKIYTGEAENPWVFPASGVRAIGDGDIIGIASAAIALSEGQFGQFPLYAFTTEGVWALSVTDTGIFNPAQPISRDVCVDANSITQIDQAVLFATDRGVMMIAGSETMCMTDGIDTDSAMLLKDMPGGESLIKMVKLDVKAFDILPFAEFLRGVRMVYDYTHQRIYLYNEQVRYAYVYSLKSKQWGMMESDIRYGVNSYPEALVVTSENKLVDLSSAEGELMRDGLMVTRALKLDGADILKTVETVIQRGYFDRGDVGTVLWGSRDLKHWHLVWTSKDHYLRGFRGTPYKYYRIGAVTRMQQDERLVGASVQLEPRETNRLR